MKKDPHGLHEDTVPDIIELYRVLGEFGQIKRITLMPNGEQESDSHHSFSLAVVAYDLAMKYASELDAKKIVLYALVHDLTELITGDMPTLVITRQQLAEKAKKDELALEQLRIRLQNYPHIVEAVEDYEMKVDAEAHFVYWVDKMVTIPTHFFDGGNNLRERGIKHRGDIKDWYDRQREKLYANGKRPPHNAVVKIFEMAYQKLHDELVPEEHEQQKLL